MNETNNNQKPKTSKLTTASYVCILIFFGSIISIVILWVFEELPSTLRPSLGCASVLSPFLSLILGIAAIVNIWRNKGLLVGMRWSIVAVIISVLIICGYFSFISYAMNQYALPYGCRTKLNKLYTYIHDYENLFIDKVIISEDWCDLLVEDLEIEPKSFICRRSDIKEGQSSYALNENVVGMKLSKIPPDVVLIFESKPGWNSVGGPESLAIKTHNFEGIYEGYFFALAGGRIVFIGKENLDTLRWEP